MQRDKDVWDCAANYLIISAFVFVLIYMCMHSFTGCQAALKLFERKQLYIFL